METLVLQEIQEHQEHRDLQELKVIRGQLDHQANRDQAVPQELEGIKVPQVLPVNLEILEPEAILV